MNASETLKAVQIDVQVSIVIKSKVDCGSSFGKEKEKNLHVISAVKRLACKRNLDERYAK